MEKKLFLRMQLVERAGEEEEDYEKTVWREVPRFDLDDSDGEPLYEDPRRSTRRWRHCGLWCELRQGRS